MFLSTEPSLQPLFSHFNGKPGLFGQHQSQLHTSTSLAENWVPDGVWCKHGELRSSLRKIVVYLVKSFCLCSVPRPQRMQWALGSDWLWDISLPLPPSFVFLFLLPPPSSFPVFLPVLLVLWSTSYSFYETGFHIARVTLELNMYPRMPLNFSSFCLHLLNAGVAAV